MMTMPSFFCVLYRKESANKQYRNTVNNLQCSSQSAPLRESHKRLRDGLALDFFNSVCLKMSLLLKLQ